MISTIKNSNVWNSARSVKLNLAGLTWQQYGNLYCADIPLQTVFGTNQITAVSTYQWWQTGHVPIVQLSWTDSSLSIISDAPITTGEVWVRGIF